MTNFQLDGSGNGTGSGSTVIAGHRYAFQFLADAATTTGTVTPSVLVGARSVPFMDQDHAEVSFDLTNSVTDGFEFLCAISGEFQVAVSGGQASSEFEYSLQAIKG